MTSPATDRARVVIHGQVQGVFFRDACSEEAASRGVSGWVRNTAEDTVEAVFEGDADAVAHMVEWCRSGPPRAHVTDVDLHPEEPDGLTDFSVRE